MKTRACFNNFESTLSVTRPLDLGAKICSPLTILTDLSISVMKIYEKMVSSICQRLLDKQWELYEVEDVPHIEGIYLIGRTDPGQDPEVLYVGRTNDVHRRMEEHKRQDLDIDRYVQEQFELNNGKYLRIKWIREINTHHRERQYHECIADKLGYWPKYNIQE